VAAVQPDDGGLRRRLQVALTSAMAARDRPVVSVLRTTLAAIANAEAVDPTGPTRPVGLRDDVERRHLDEEDVRAIVRREREELRSAADELARVGRPDRAEALRAQAAVITAHLDGAPRPPEEGAPAR
jgi:hypothetical protein